MVGGHIKGLGDVLAGWAFAGKTSLTAEIGFEIHEISGVKAHVIATDDILLFKSALCRVFEFAVVDGILIGSRRGLYAVFVSTRVINKAIRAHFLDLDFNRFFYI